MGKHEGNCKRSIDAMALIKDVIISKTTQVDTQMGQQIVLSEKKTKENKKTYISKEIKTRVEDTNGHKIEEKEDVSSRRAQEREHKERKERETNFNIKGIRDYGKNESTFNLTRDFLREKLQWRGKICQATRVGNIEERP